MPWRIATKRKETGRLCNDVKIHGRFCLHKSRRIDRCSRDLPSDIDVDEFRMFLAGNTSTHRGDCKLLVLLRRGEEYTSGVLYSV